MNKLNKLRRHFTSAFIDLCNVKAVLGRAVVLSFSKVLIWSLFLVMANSSIATAAVDLNSQEVNASEAARKRSYPGGSLEEDLKVQEVLADPVRTVYRSNIDEEVIKEFKKQKTDSSSSGSN